MIQNDQSQSPGLAAAETQEAIDAEKKKWINSQLFFCVKSGRANLVEEMIEKGIDLNPQDESGMTPLHHAVALGARPCIRVLVNSGRCDYLIRDNEGRYASDIAIEWSRDFAVARLLSKHQARQAYERGVLPFEN